MRRSLVLAGLLVLARSVGAQGSGAHTSQVQSLAGHPSVYVLIERFTPAVVSAGVDSNTIKAQALRRFRQAGIPTRGDGEPPLFYFRFSTLPSTTGGERYAYTTACSFHQRTNL